MTKCHIGRVGSYLYPYSRFIFPNNYVLFYKQICAYSMMFVTCCICTVQLRHVGASQHRQFQVRFDWPDHHLSSRVLVSILKCGLY